MYTLEWAYGGINGPHLDIKHDGKWVGHLYFDCEDQDEEERRLRETLENKDPSP